MEAKNPSSDLKRKQLYCNLPRKKKAALSLTAIEEQYTEDMVERRKHTALVCADFTSELGDVDEATVNGKGYVIPQNKALRLDTFFVNDCHCERHTQFTTGELISLLDHLHIPEWIHAGSYCYHREELTIFTLEHLMGGQSFSRQAERRDFGGSVTRCDKIYDYILKYHSKRPRNGNSTDGHLDHIDLPCREEFNICFNLDAKAAKICRTGSAPEPQVSPFRKPDSPEMKTAFWIPHPETHALKMLGGQLPNGLWGFSSGGT